MTPVTRALVFSSSGECGRERRGEGAARSLLCISRYGVECGVWTSGDMAGDNGIEECWLRRTVWCGLVRVNRWNDIFFKCLMMIDIA